MKRRNGYIALVSFLIIGLVALSVAVSVSFLGIEVGKTSLTATRGEQTFWLAKSCLNQALLKLRNDQTYSGEELTFSTGSCTIIINGSGLKTINLEARLNTKPDLVRHFSGQVKVSGSHLRLLQLIEN